MARSKGPKFYAVVQGRAPGIYNRWAECEAQVKGFGGAMFKSFHTRTEAELFYSLHSATSSGQQGNINLASSDECDATLGKKRPAEYADGRTSNNKWVKCDNTTWQSHVIIYFDGGSRGNPGVAGAGAEVTFISQDKRRTTLIREYCGDKQTNNFAEYTGLIMGLTYAKRLMRKELENICIETTSSRHHSYIVNVYGDSNLVIQQVKRCWQCKNDNIKPLYDKAHQLHKEIIDILGTDGTVTFEHVYREQNKVADELSNEAMDQKRSWSTTTEEIFSYRKIGPNPNKNSVDSRKPAANEKERIELGDSDDQSVAFC